MSHPVRGVDHAFLLTGDLDRAAALYERLGFTLSPRGLHSLSKGTGNHTIMFQNDYFELLGIVAPVKGNAARRETLKREGDSLQAVACRIEDARAAKAALGEIGLKTGPVADFERQVDLPGGGTAPAAFSTLPFEDEHVPFAHVFMCQHKTRDTVWIPELMRHPNRASGILRIYARSPGPEADAALLARLFAEGSVSSIPGGAELATGPNSARIVLLTAAALAARFPGMDLGGGAARGLVGLSLRSDDLAETARVLERAGIAATQTEDGLAVPPALAVGAIVEFAAS